MPVKNPEVPEKKLHMRKEIGLLEGVTILLGIVFGSGIFISPTEVIKAVGSVWGSLTIWAMCGILSMLGALCYAELGTTIIGAGGDYLYLRETYGQIISFLFLWDALLVFIPCTNAIVAITFANNVLYPFTGGCPVNIYSQKLLSAAILCLVTFANAYNVRITAKLQNLFMFVTVSAVAVIAVTGIVWLALGNTQNLEDGWKGTKPSVSDWAIAFYAGIFAYSGWNFLNFMIEELKNPNKNLPRAIYVSMPLMTAIYLITNLAYLSVIPTQRIKQTEAIAIDFAATALGFMRYVMPVSVAISSLGGLSSHIMTTSRICFAGARNGHMPNILAQINIKYLSPLPSLLFIMFLSLMLLIPSDISFLITFCCMVDSFFIIVTCTCILWLRYKEPNLPGIKNPLCIPVTFIVLSSFIQLVPIYRKPHVVLSAVAVTITGVPVYFLFVKYRSRRVARLSSKENHFILVVPGGNKNTITVFCQKLFYCALEDKESEN